MDGAARRRAEIEAKKAKLAELRRLREQRQTSIVTSQLQEAPDVTSTTLSSLQLQDRKSLDDLVNSLVGDVPGTRETRLTRKNTAIGTNIDVGDESSREPQQENLTAAHEAAAISDQFASTQVGPSNTISPEALQDNAVQEEHPDARNISTHRKFEKSVVTYTKATQTQTDESQSEDDLSEPETQKIEETYAELVARLRSEIENELLLKVEAENRLSQAAHEHEGARLSDSHEVNSEKPQEITIFEGQGDPSRSLPDYTQDIETIHEATNDGTLMQIFEFSSDSTKNRMITSVSWSVRFAELVLASYSKSQVLNNSINGLVHVWNTKAPERPEFTLTCQSEVQHAVFSPYHANIIVGGTYSGQIIVWDIKVKTQPILITPLNGKGHTYPITGLNIVGTKQASSIVSTSSDGTVCTWSPDILAQPQDVFELTLLPPNKVEEVTPTAVSHSSSDASTFMIGTEDGNMHSVNRQDRAGARAGIDPKHVYKGHAAMITGIDHHRCKGHLDLSDLILTSSLDWTVRLWRLASPGTISVGTTGLSGQAVNVNALMEFTCNDMVYDVRWSPTNPAVFALVDGLGNCLVYDLCRNTEIPVASSYANTTTDDLNTVKKRRALNKVGWDVEGRYLAIGGLDGKLAILALPANLTDKNNISPEQWVLLNNRLKAAARK